MKNNLTLHLCVLAAGVYNYNAIPFYFKKFTTIKIFSTQKVLRDIIDRNYQFSLSFG